MQRRKLRIEDIAEATKMVQEAFREDAAVHYIFDAPDAKGDHYVEWNRQLAIGVEHACTDDMGWTIGDFFSVVTYYTPETSKEGAEDSKAWIERMLSSDELSEGQKERVREFSEKAGKAGHQALGDRAPEMYYIPIVGTALDHRRKGYATTVVNGILEEADARGRATWLVSGTKKNEPFYNSLGFVAGADVNLGVDNPDHKGEPVIMQIMVREPKPKV